MHVEGNLDVVRIDRICYLLRVGYVGYVGCR